MAKTQIETGVGPAVEALLDAAVLAKTQRGFLGRALEILCETSEGLAARAELSEEAQVLTASYLREGQAAEFWERPLRELMDDCQSERQVQIQRYGGKRTGVGIAVFALPVRTPKGGGSIALALPCRSEKQALGQIERLETLVALLAIHLDSIDAKPAAKDADKDAAESVAQALRRAADFESAVQLAMTVTNRLASREGFEQVALGRVSGKRVKLLAVSGLDHVEAKSEAIGRIEQAMQECFDFGQTLCVQKDGIESETPIESGHLHQRWHEAARYVPVASLPLANPDGTVAVLSVVRSKRAPFTGEELEAIHKMVLPFGAALPVVERATRSLIDHAFQTAVSSPARFLSRHNIGRKLVGVSLALFTGWSLFGTLSYRVSAESELAPRDVRSVGAPVSAPLAEAPFAAGMTVRAGDVLARFDTAALELEAKRLTAEIKIKETEANLAIAEGNPVDHQLAQASLGELRANLDIVTHEIAAASIVAPMDGILLEGDLRERVGDRFQLGEPLFRIAAGTGYTLELYIDEADIDEITPAQLGHFATFARPEIDFPLNVTRVAPAAEKRDEVNSFRVEATVEVDEPWARAGMQGVAKIDAGKRRPIWIWTHKLLDGLRMKSWL